MDHASILHPTTINPKTEGVLLGIGKTQFAWHVPKTGYSISMVSVLKLINSAAPMTLILECVLAAIEDISFKQAKVMDLKMHHVFILLPIILPCQMLDARFGTGIQILVLNAHNIGTL
jgi:hypothetical protein